MSKSASILVVDDDPEIVALLSTRLGHRGYQVSTASDGHRALELAKRERPALMILDVMMPGKSGWEVAKAIKHDPVTKDIKILMLSAMGKANELTATISGADASLDKPFEFDELERLIGKLIG
jgi:DNA-binding response OmpR family regulator